ncbi:hypothetical protein [Arcobacter sp. FWKO B]|uniref:hypothetical protein n=1 Tax=Arcobacter sp. FWKO B TaxID=2593672 RepID=UPI0018A5E8E2|nr:hypothetical protein [Arcobacter sp. FWKO B]QOG13196.1 hypothetical protein FWKOB_11065 [Arcobacter sp. FWKO B]
MILIGDEIIPYEAIYKISTVDDIKNTMPNSTVIFEYNSDLMTYCKNNSVKYGVIVSSLKEAVYANALGAKYIISDIKLASKLQKIAQNYMYDARILAVISDDSQIEDIALQEIDGAIYSYLI